MSGYSSKQGLSRPPPRQVKADSMELGAVEYGVKLEKWERDASVSR
jgi:hypothetical protein